MSARLNIRGKYMATVGLGTIVISLGAMYVMGKDTKKIEGHDSPYKHHDALGGSDVRMNSSDVAAAVSVPKPGRERLHHQSESE